MAALARFVQNSSFRIFHICLKCAGRRQVNVPGCSHLKVYFYQRSVACLFLELCPFCGRRTKFNTFWKFRAFCCMTGAGLWTLFQSFSSVWRAGYFVHVAKTLAGVAKNEQWRCRSFCVAGAASLVKVADVLDANAPFFRAPSFLDSVPGDHVEGAVLQMLRRIFRGKHNIFQTSMEKRSKPT